ncbi:MAG: YfhO family protein, partial [bacterium]
PQLFQDIVDNNLFLSLRGSTGLNWKVVNMLNSTYIISPGKLDNPYLNLMAEDKNSRLVLYKNDKYLPRAYFVQGVKQFGNEKEIVEFMNTNDFQPSILALTSENIDIQSGYDTSATSEITTYTPNRVELKVQADSKAFMVLADAYYPKGWKAEIDGERTHIYQVNHMLRGIIVSPGNHTITFDFYPQSYKSAKIISYVSVYAVWLILVL